MEVGQAFDPHSFSDPGDRIRKYEIPDIAQDNAADDIRRKKPVRNRLWPFIRWLPLTPVKSDQITSQYAQKHIENRFQHGGKKRRVPKDRNIIFDAYKVNIHRQAVPVRESDRHSI